MGLTNSETPLPETPSDMCPGICLLSKPRAPVIVPRVGSGLGIQGALKEKKFQKITSGQDTGWLNKGRGGHRRKIWKNLQSQAESAPAREDVADTLCIINTS